MRKILFSVFEKSADFYAARLIPYLADSFVVTGYGGPEMEEKCRRITNQIQKSSVMGISGLFLRMPYFVHLLMKLRRKIERSEGVILVDFAGLNLRLLSYAAERGKKAVYLIPPKFWAWSPERSVLLKKCSAVFPLFPFEHEQLCSTGVPSFYFGHPLYEELRTTARRTPVPGRIGIFPGSRPDEIEYTLPVILEALSGTGGEFLLFLADSSDEFSRRINRIISRTDLPLQFVSPLSKYEKMGTLEKAVACSGTVALELSYYSIPTVVVYRTTWLSYQYFKDRIRLKHYSLPNILAGGEVYPELIQSGFNARTLKDRLTDMPPGKQIDSECSKIWDTLKGENISQRIAEKMIEVL
ncbi:MAG: hypothetical protein PHQ23_09475 [Candidatus Wallbacteria bacterium]|nr:hypothetical protein [Candidatus Wallbacteria bacterium]